MVHSKRGQPRLRGLLQAGTTLRGVYKKREHFAKVDKDGRIHIGDQIFNSPTLASEHVRRQNYDGWLFWRFKNNKGEWVPINELRKKKP